MDIVKSKGEILKRSEDMILLYFGSKSCGVCHSLKPKVEKILEKYPKIKSLYVDVEESIELAAEYNEYNMKQRLTSLSD